MFEPWAPPGPPSPGRVEVVESYGRGTVYYPLDGDPRWDLRRATLQQRAILEDHGTQIRQDGQVLEGKRRQRIIDLLLGKFADMPAVFDPSDMVWTVRPYIPGLWSHGTMPALVGPKAWGKTKVTCALAAALVTPGRRLLGYFDPVQVSASERARHVWLLNGETHPGVVHAELLANGLTFGRRGRVPFYFADTDGTGEPPKGQGVLIVEHLVVTSATAFDLTDEAKFDWWAARLTAYVNVRVPPLTIIADGVTAILGSHTNRYGEFSSAFHDLLRETGIPNGLGTLHSPMGVNTATPMHGVESMGLWDGLWLASSPAFPIRPTDRRYLETFPRLGDPRLDPAEVVVDDDGLLSLLVDSKPPTSSGSGDAEQVGDRKAVLLDRLRAAATEWLWTKEACRGGEDYKPDRAALDELHDKGLVEMERVTTGQTRGMRWRLVAERGSG